MIARRPPPVHSPVSPRALAAGWAAAFGLGDPASTQRLNTELQRRYSADTVVLMDSGTSALAVAIAAALRSRPGAPVALPAYGCYDIATAAAAANATVLLYDINPSTLGPDWPSLERAVAAGAGAVVVAYLFGFPVDMARVDALCGATGALVIEDAAQGSGGKWNGVPLGAISPLGILSFGRGKGITGGGGGAILARGAGVAILEAQPPALEPPANAARALTALSAQWLLARPSLYAIPSSLPFLRLGETVYHEPHLPRALPAGQAAVILDALNRADGEADVRRERAATYERAGASGGTPFIGPIAGAVPGYLRFPLLARHGQRAPGKGIGGAHAYPLPLSRLPQLAPRLRNRDHAFPGAETLAGALHTLPTHSRLAQYDVERVASWLRASP